MIGSSYPRSYVFNTGAEHFHHWLTTHTVLFKTTHTSALAKDCKLMKYIPLECISKESGSGIVLPFLVIAYLTLAWFGY